MHLPVVHALSAVLHVCVVHAVLSDPNLKISRASELAQVTSMSPVTISCLSACKLFSNALTAAFTSADIDIDKQIEHAPQALQTASQPSILPPH